MYDIMNCNFIGFMIFIRDCLDVFFFIVCMEVLDIKSFDEKFKRIIFFDLLYF